MEKKVDRLPVEVFCHDSSEMTDELKLAISQQYCRFIKSTCVKPRKSEPSVKVGICSLGATVARQQEIQPVIICPQRFKEDNVFEILRQKYLSDWENVKWVKEVDIGVGGSVDYVAIELSRNNKITNFQCFEIQAAGTTGTPYPAVLDLKRYGHYPSDKKYSYGINWANEFSKTMMQQAYKKGKIVETWKRKIVFVVQDVAMAYLTSSSDCSLLVDYDKSLPVDFFSLKMKWLEDAKEWTLIFDDIKSTSVDGINRILGGAAVEEYLTETEFVSKIMEKAISDGVISDNRLYFDF